MLTIAIPTFNRNHLLKAGISRVLGQLGDGDELLIVDNHSDVPVSETLGGWLEQQENREKVRIIRNPTNIGGAANILRCLELCETKWLYCLGDDDQVVEDCVERIKQTLEGHPDALYLSFNRPALLRKATFISEGLAEFIQRLDSWSSFLFMSASVINAPRLKEDCRFGYLYAYSWAPLQAILIKALKSGGKVVFSDKFLCAGESLAEETWVPFLVAAGKMVLPELVDDPGMRKRLARKLMAEPSLLSLIYWARVKARSPLENEFVINLYIDRCRSYSGGLSLFFYKRLSQVILRPNLLPDWLFAHVEGSVFRLLRRPIPQVKRMSHDRT